MGEEVTRVQRAALVFIHLSSAWEMATMPTDRQVIGASGIMSSLPSSYILRELST